MTFAKWSLIGATVLLAACGPGREAAARASRAVEDERRGAEVELRRKLAEMDRRIEKLRQSARSVGHGREEIEAQLRELERLRQQLRSETEQAQKSGHRFLDRLERAFAGWRSE